MFLKMGLGLVVFILLQLTSFALFPPMECDL